jgi:hypothetical protein
MTATPQFANSNGFCSNSLLFTYLNCLIDFSGLAVCLASAARTKQQPVQQQQSTTQIPPADNDVDWLEDDYVPIKVDGKNAFDWKLVKAVMAEDKSNVFISPFSVKLLLTVLLEASDPGSKTQKELAITNPNLNPNVPFQYRDSYLRSLASFRVSHLALWYHNMVLRQPLRFVFRTSQNTTILTLAPEYSLITQ